MDLLIFQRLTQDLQAFSGKFRHLIQKKHTSVCKSDLPRSPVLLPPPARAWRGTWYDADLRKGLCRISGFFFREKSCHTVYLGVFPGFPTNVISGIIVGRRLASMVFPDPGGPNKKNIIENRSLRSRPRAGLLPARRCPQNQLFGFPVYFLFFFFLILICISVWVSQTSDHVIQTFYSKHRHILHQIPLPDIFLRNNAKA